MKKIILDTSTFTFDASAQTITFDTKYELVHILLITNVTDNIILFNFGCDGFGGSISGKTLTLEYNTTGMSDTDDIQIILYDVDGESDKESTDLLTLIRDHLEVQDEILEELRICSKYLRKIYDPE